jgi:hypothetical protein
VPAVPARLRAGAVTRGGVLGYPLDELHGEVAFIAYHFHWPHEEIMTLEHVERRRWVREISTINREVNAG